MPGPTTEVLNDDVEQLSREVHDLRVEVVQGFGVLREELSRADGKLREEIAEFRGEVRNSLKFMKWIGTFAAAVFVAGIGATFGVVWQAAKLDSRVNAIETRVGERIERVEKAVGELGTKLDRIEKAVGSPEKVRPLTSP